LEIFYANRELKSDLYQKTIISKKIVSKNDIPIFF